MPGRTTCDSETRGYPQFAAAKGESLIRKILSNAFNGKPRTLAVDVLEYD
jgi:hypothetical protein